MLFVAVTKPTKLFEGQVAHPTALWSRTVPIQMDDSLFLDVTAHFHRSNRMLHGNVSWIRD